MITIGLNPITLQNCVDVAMFKQEVSISSEAINKITESRKTIENIIANKQIKYGITTGFGSLNNVVIEPDKLIDLQQNLIRSHAVGIGEPCAIHIVRCMTFLRLVCICNGNSGVRLEVAEKLVEALNKNFCPMIPCQGTVGASGDLAPLSHLVLGLMGEGTALDHQTGKYQNAAQILKNLNMTPLVLKEKEGLALNNGTQFITSHAIFACWDAIEIFNQSNMIASMTIEGLHGTHHAFNPLIHKAKPHFGQQYVAEKINSYILDKDGEPSQINKKNTQSKVQDGYSLRCIPQIHGPVLDILIFAQRIIETEINSSNDNPLIFGDQVISGGNFHGMYIGMVTDQISYAMSILCNISERRLERLLNPDLNKFLPSFLVNNTGLNSGFMITQYAAAALTAENRNLANPASVNNIPTCQGSEDIVSMAGWAARKAVQSVKNTYKVLAFELFAACQALDETKEMTTEKLQKIHNHVRKSVPHITNDVYMKPYVDILVDILESGELLRLS